jgi:hypothetical protein
MSLAAMFNLLGQTIVPQIMDAAFPDTLSVMVETTTAGTGGGRIKTLEAANAAWVGVPCRYAPIQKFGWQKEQAEQPVGTQKYLVVCPMYHNGVRVSLTSNHKLRVAARGGEPVKTFKIDQPPGDVQGVNWEVVATKEN